MTEKEKIDKFITWIRNQKNSANNEAAGGASSWNWAYAEAMEKVYNKAKTLFKEDKKS